MKEIKTNKLVNKCPKCNNIIKIRKYTEYGKELKEGEKGFGLFRGFCLLDKIMFILINKNK